MVAYFLHKVSSVSQDNIAPKIVGGWEANIQEVPYFARVSYSYNFFNETITSSCGATIIHRQWLLIAAHCVQKSIIKQIPLWIILGVDNLADKENMPKKRDDTLPRVDIIRCHPRYQRQLVGWGQPIVFDQIKHDICLLRTDHLLELGKYVNRAGLPWTAYDQELIVKPLSLSGYGRTGFREEESDKLRSTKLKLMMHKECESSFNLPGYPTFYFRDFAICVKSVDHEVRSACFGDSGGGLIYKDSISGCPIVIGVASSTSIPFCKDFSQYTRVSAYKTWIKETIERYSYPSETKSRYKYPTRNSVD